MKRTNGKVWVLILIMLCAIFPFTNFFVKDNASATGGVYVESGANVQINGGLFADSINTAFTFADGEHTLANVTITGSTNGAIYLAGGGILNSNKL